MVSVTKCTMGHNVLKWESLALIPINDGHNGLIPSHNVTFHLECILWHDALMKSGLGRFSVTRKQRQFNVSLWQCHNSGLWKKHASLIWLLLGCFRVVQRCDGKTTELQRCFHVGLGLVPTGVVILCCTLKKLCQSKIGI